MQKKLQLNPFLLCFTDGNEPLRSLFGPKPGVPDHQNVGNNCGIEVIIPSKYNAQAQSLTVRCSSPARD